MMEFTQSMETCVANRIKALRDRIKSVKPLNFKEFCSLFENTEQISETSAAVAIVGLLLGFPSHLYSETENGFLVKSDVSVGDLTNACSKNFLRHFVEFGNDVCELASFCTEAKRKCILNEISHSLTGYAYSLEELINRCVLGKLVYSFDGYIRNTPKPRLLHFTDFLNSKETDFVLKKLSVLSQVHKAVVEEESFEYNSLCTANILNVLYLQLCSCGEESQSLIWTLFLSVFRVTLNYLQHLLSSGVANDVHKEFFIELNETADMENFWDTCVLLNESSVPQFLKPHLLRILIGVKSNYLLRTSVVEVIPSHPRTSIFERFYEKFVKEYRSTVNSAASKHDSKVVSKILEETCLNLPRHIPLKNSKMKHEYNFLDVCNKTTYKIEEIEAMKENNFGPEFEFVSGCISFEVAFDRSLSFSLNEYIDPICSATIHYFLPNYLKHLKVMNENSLLLKCDHQLSIYLSYVFSDVTHSPGIGLFSSFWTDYCFDDSSVRAFLSRTLQDECSRHEILSNLHLIYRETDHLSASILNTDAHEIYDQCFQFLLELKYCKWLLENIELKRTSRDVSLNSKQRQQFLIRFRFLAVVNFAHSMILYRLENAVETLYAKNSCADNYETLREHFLHFESELQTITCQDKSKNATLVKKVIRKMSQDAVCLWDLWHENDYSKKQQFLSKLEVNLQRCQSILEVYL